MPTIKFQLKNQGFTLVELLLAMVISSIILLALFVIFQFQQRHYSNQLEVTDIQQNIRAAMNIISRDVRMAGFDVDPSTGVAQIINAKNDLFYFTSDINEDGDTDDIGEHIAYDTYIAADGTLTLGRTSSNSTITVLQTLGRWEVTNPSHQPVAQNIENLEFFYLDENGNATTTENSVRTVIISILARSDLADPKFSNTQTYNPASNLAYYNTGTLSGRSWVKNDNYRRRMQTLRVECRNIGL